MQQPLRPLLAAVALSALAGCTGGGGHYGETGYYGSSPPAAVAMRPTAPAANFAGAWRLAAAGGAACTMHFGSGPESEGTIRPEGGCPGDFYTSRRWTFEDNALVIRDHNRGELARLRMASPNHFEGSSAGGQPLTLTR